MNRNEEIMAVKALGERIGYGNLMDIASGLWAVDLAQNGFPVDGVYVPVIMPYVKKKIRDNVFDEMMVRYNEVLAMMGEMQK